MKHQRFRRGRAVTAAEALFQEALLGGPSTERERGDDRKTLQLCRQVERALGLALAGECDDDLLRELYVVAVRPMGSASQLLVSIAIPPQVRVSPLQVMERLESRSARLRSIVAQSIHRKRTPTLSYIVVPAPDTHEGGPDATA